MVQAGARTLHGRRPSRGREVAGAYSVWGGVPRYWVAAERYGKDLDAAVDEQVLDSLGLFHDEPMTLLQSEIPSAASLKPYLDVIGGGANRVSEIAERLGVSATALSRPLARLVELGLIKREIPFGESEKNSKKSLYRLADPFCKFWFGVVASRRSAFARASESVLLPRVKSGIWRPTFVRACRRPACRQMPFAFFSSHRPRRASKRRMVSRSLRPDRLSDRG